VFLTTLSAWGLGYRLRIVAIKTFQTLAATTEAHVSTSRSIRTTSASFGLLGFCTGPGER
jgi:hypothetical protein